MITPLACARIFQLSVDNITKIGMTVLLFMRSPFPYKLAGGLVLCMQKIMRLKVAFFESVTFALMFWVHGSHVAFKAYRNDNGGVQK